MHFLKVLFTVKHAMVCGKKVLFTVKHWHVVECGKVSFTVRPSQVIFLFLIPSRINFWLFTILAIIGIVHALFYLMLIAKHMASVYRLVKCLYTCKNYMIGSYIFICSHRFITPGRVYEPMMQYTMPVSLVCAQNRASCW